jgi:chromate transporter
LIWVQMLLGFLIANLLGYGGGPASIPLIQDQVSSHYQWLTNEDFVHILAMGNALPGPIATKIAAYVGYSQIGWGGAIVALLATIVPSSVAVIALLNLLNRYRQSPIVKGMTLLVQPVIAVLMVVLTWQIGKPSSGAIGYLPFFIIFIISLLATEKYKIHPALVIVCAFLYGGFFLG